jgi:glycosyltransferase involved in cell wall biosynthesis
MKKTLLVCDFHPLGPRYGASMRTMNFVSFFGSYGRVDLCYNVFSPVATAEASLFSNEYFLEKANYSKGYKEHLLRVLRGMPYPIREYRSKSRWLLTSLIDSDEYDYVLVRYINHGNGLKTLKPRSRKKIIVDFDDIMSGPLYKTFFYPTKRPVSILLRRFNNKLLAHYERGFLRFGASLFCSENDRIKVAGQKKKGTFVVPNIYDDNSFFEYDFGDGSRNENTILFVGALDYEPNMQGLKWFLTSVFGELRKSYPKLTFLVVGRSPAREIQELCAKTAGVELHADAPDIKEYYSRCRAAVVPLLSGGGTRIKILEAAFAGRPVISTPLGAEGLDLKDGMDVLFFENAAGFFCKYEALLDKNTYMSIVENAKRVVEAKYSAKVFDHAMKTVVSYLDSSSDQSLGL